MNKQTNFWQTLSLPWQACTFISGELTQWAKAGIPTAQVVNTLAKRL